MFFSDWESKTDSKNDAELVVKALAFRDLEAKTLPFEAVLGRFVNLSSFFL